MSDMPLFDAARAEAAADGGRDRAVKGVPPWNMNFLPDAQNVARNMARRLGVVTADDVVRFYATQGVDLPLILGPAMGSLFRCGGWEWTGKTVKSERVSRRANLIRVWRLEE